MERKTIGVVAVVAVLASGAVATAGLLAPGTGRVDVPDEVSSSRPAPFYIADGVIHDGDREVDTGDAIIGFANSLERVAGGWLLGKWEDDTNDAYLVSEDGGVRKVASLPYGTVWDVHAAGRRLAFVHGRRYQWLDLTDPAARARDLPLRPAGRPTGDIGWSGDDVIAGWLPAGSKQPALVVHHTDGSTEVISKGAPVDQISASPDGAYVVGTDREAEGDPFSCLAGRPVADAENRWPRRICDEYIISTSPYSPDGTRFVSVAWALNADGASAVVVRAADDGRRLSRFATGSLTNDVTWAGPDTIAFVHDRTLQYCSTDGSCAQVANAAEWLTAGTDTGVTR
ncbi:hypothetical protein [Pimelobacter sp. 30-1]|uniref:hypothetical protein n=1 Tax=Pimelobacter sp. 30-1 TaxID=2004991 RepID=UPI001C04B42B|nr:hypothetical protein [Pimelobacter sp. 30-1]MBU2698099.1 hypothetical protein [Pimelobacter sp. 30-1]